MNDALTAEQTSDLLRLLHRHWGYDAFLPSQAEAIGPIMAGRDTLVILPTGGGKSLTYQLPALALPGTALVISPLLALMKDQVDALIRVGVSAAALNSTLSAPERRDVVRRYRNGELKLLYVSPEGLATEGVMGLLCEGNVSFVAVDEAHCISQWGHEYRADYRNIGRLRDRLPHVPIHALTATATPIVRDDIVNNLGQRDAVRVVGSFVRQNLTYRTVYRHDALSQVREVIDRHPGDAGIVYAISRKDVEALALSLQKAKVRALPYHAGLDQETRRDHQEKFSREEVDVIVATVAFGMGIDRSNVRYVVHAGMPRSLENYQQEAGRAGRDRLDAECVLIYSAQDLLTWRRILGAPASDHDRRAQDKLGEVYRFARTLGCRHRFLVEYFGEHYAAERCGACDVCLDEHEVMPDSVVTTQKILSGVLRLHERFGAHYVAEVLHGANLEKIRSAGHDQLSTYGLLSSFTTSAIQDWIDQLVTLGYLERVGEYQTLSLTGSGRVALKGQAPVKLSIPRRVEKRKRERERSKGAPAASSGSDTLFDLLRAWRRQTAQAEGMPSYIVFGDAALRDIADRRPSTPTELLECKGVGEKKLERYGEAVLSVVRGEWQPG